MEKYIMMSNSTAIQFAIDVTKLAVENGLANDFGGPAETRAEEVATFYKTFLARITSDSED